MTPWVDAPRAAGPADAALLGRLHAAPPPPGLRPWRPLVGPGLADDLVVRLREPWAAGPHGEAARAALRDHLADVAGWVADYHRLAATTDPATWVTTHGEPHERNLLVGPDGPLLVDWETVMLAPRERDLRQCGLPGDDDLLRMFDLEWRLDEISQYADWFEQPHGDGDDDRVALGGLTHELTRPDPTATDGIVDRLPPVTGTGTQPVVDEVPQSAWVLGWACLVGQVATLLDRGVTGADSMLLSAPLSALAVGWVSYGVLRARLVRTWFAGILLGLVALLERGRPDPRHRRCPTWSARSPAWSPWPPSWPTPAPTASPGSRRTRAGSARRSAGSWPSPSWSAPSAA